MPQPELSGAEVKRTSLPSSPSFFLLAMPNSSFIDSLDRMSEPSLSSASFITIASLVSDSSEYPFPVRDESHSLAMCIVSPPKPAG